jgi:DNA-3-methyladenine glycosylase I
VANYTEKDVDRILNNRDVIRNKAKIIAAIDNAKKFAKIQQEYGTFDVFIWRFVYGKPIHNSYSKLSDLPTETEISKAMSNMLKKRGFK